MGWLSKVFGIDARRNAERAAQLAADKAAADAKAAQEKAAAQAERTAAQTKQYNDSMLEIQKQSLSTQQNAAAAEQQRINDARDAAIARDAADAQKQANADVLNANNRVDLRADTTANVVAGGMADVIDTAVQSVKKKSATATTLAQQLGINI